MTLNELLQLQRGLHGIVPSLIFWSTIPSPLVDSPQCTHSTVVSSLKKNPWSYILLQFKPYFFSLLFQWNFSSESWVNSILPSWRSVLGVLAWDTTFQQHLTHPGFPHSETQLFLVSFLSPLATLPSSPLQTLPHWTVPGVSLWNFSVLFSMLPWWFHSVSWKLQT